MITQQIIEIYIILIFNNIIRFTKDDDLLKHSFRVSDHQIISTSGSVKQRLDITELDAGKIDFPLNAVTLLLLLSRCF